MKDIILLCLLLFMLSKILLLLIIFFIYNNISLLFLFLLFTLFVYFKGSTEFKTNIGNKIKSILYTSPTEWFDSEWFDYVQTLNPVTFIFNKHITENFETIDDDDDDDDNSSVDTDSVTSTEDTDINETLSQTLSVPEKFKAPIKEASEKSFSEKSSEKSFKAPLQKSQSSVSGMADDLGLFAKLIDELDNKDLENDFAETRNDLSRTLNDNEKKLLDQLKVSQNDIEVGYENFIQKSASLGSKEMNQLKNTINKLK